MKLPDHLQKIIEAENRSAKILDPQTCPKERELLRKEAVISISASPLSRIASMKRKQLEVMGKGDAYHAGRIKKKFVGLALETFRKQTAHFHLHDTPTDDFEKRLKETLEEGNRLLDAMKGNLSKKEVHPSGISPALSRQIGKVLDAAYLFRSKHGRKPSTKELETRAETVANVGCYLKERNIDLPWDPIKQGPKSS